MGALADQADRHQLTPLLHARAGADAAVPQEIRGRLRRAYVTAAARNLQLYSQLEKVLEVLRERGVEIILLKGVYLAQEVYRNVALRPMTDIDLLARREDLPNVIDALRSLGYAPEQDGKIGEQCKQAAHLPAMLRENSFSIEVHWHIEGPDSPYRVDLEGLWERRRAVKIGGQDAFALSAEDTLLHLCLHAARHARRDWFDEFALKSLCDIARAAEATSLDWDAVESRAAEAGAVRAVFLMLTLARDWLGADIAEQMLGRMRPVDFDARMLDWARTQILCPLEASPVGTHTARLLGSEPLHRRAGMLLTRLLPPPGEIARRYSVPKGSLRLPIYYLVRLKELVFRDAGSVWQMMWGDERIGDLMDRAAGQRALQEWLAAG